jgi:hypothetical protein
MVCGHTYSIRGNWHPDGEAPSGITDPWGFYNAVVSISSFFCVMSRKMRCKFSRNQDDLKDHSLGCSARSISSLRFRADQSGDSLKERHRITPFTALRSPPFRKV